EIALLQTFADQAVIAVENARLLTELQASNEDLGEALERQTATADILRAISQAQTDVQPVFDAIADSTMRLFGAVSTMVFRYDGELLTGVAARGGPPKSSELMMERWRGPHRPSEFSPADQMPGHRAVLTRAVQHVVDVDTDSSWSALLRETAEVRGFRS